MPNPPNDARLRTPVRASLQDNISALKEIFHLPTNADIVLRDMDACGFGLCLVYLEGMAGGRLIGETIIRPCLRAEVPDALDPSERAEHIAKRVLGNAQVRQSDVMRELVEAILDGNTIVLIEGTAQALIVETRDYEKRNVDRTQTESIVVGAQQGFVESLRTNITLVRRMVHSPALVSEMIDVGNQIPTGISIMYLDGVANQSALDEVKRRIRALDVDYITNIGHLEELIEDSQLFMLPQMLQTERPDRVAPALCDGQIAILMDNSPYALVAPITFFHLFHATDDDFMRWQYGSFTRILRLLGITISLFLPGLYVAITLYHTHMIPLSLLTSIAETRAQVPFPIVIEVLFMEFSFFMINEAGTRMPTQIGSALGIVGALILGQSAVAASIISPVLIIIVALAGLGNYAAPVYSLTIAFSILRLFVLGAGAAFGLYGIIVIGFVFLCAMCNARSLGEPMMAPLSTREKHNPDLILRMPVSMQNKQPFSANRNSWLKRTKSGGRMRRWKGGGQ